MHFSELTEVEQRVFGCLIEKRWTTPDQYPLSLNALRLACNQSTNRDPVTQYTDDEVFQAAQRLTKYGLARLASGHTSRATKYRHLAEEALGLDREQLAVLCVMLLRGPQTPGELKQRSERMASLPALADVDRVLGQLGERGYVTNLGRQPGQKEDRFAQLLGGEVTDSQAARTFASSPSAAPGADPGADGSSGPLSSTAPAPAPAPDLSGAPGDPDGLPARREVPDLYTATAVDVVALQARVAALESALTDRVAALESELASLREQLADLLT